MASFGPGASDSGDETSVHTEPSAGDDEREAFEPYRVARNKPVVQGFREWWLSNPLNNLWTKKPNLWTTFKAEAAGATPEEAAKSGANVKLEDIVRRGPTLGDVLEEGEYELVELPSDEAWFGQPDPGVYAAGTNDLTKEQLAQEVAKGNVCTLRQLKQHLATASSAELELWHAVLTAQELRDNVFVQLPEGRVSVWDLLTYVRANPELAALAQRDLNLAVPAEGMTREERIARLIELAPWKFSANQRHMVLPPSRAAKLPWGLLAGGTWWSRRPTRWLKGLDGQRDFFYGLYCHEQAARELLGEAWGGRAPEAVLADKAFYREALGLAPSLGMTLLAVASRPLPLEEVTQAWEQRVKQQLDRMDAAAASSSSTGGPQLLLSTTSASLSGSHSETGSASDEELSSSSSEAVMVAAATAAASAAAARPPRPAQAAPPGPAVVAAEPASAPMHHPPPPPLPQQQQQPQQPQQQPVAQQPVAQQPAAQQAPPPALQQQQQPPAAVPPAPADAPAAGALVPASPAREVEPRYAGLAQLVGLFDRKRLGEQTELLDFRGTKLREGATIIFTAHPSGGLMVQAVSPGLVKEQRSYLLGSVTGDPRLTRAVMALFLDPDSTLDSEFTATAGTTLLAFANGYRHAQEQPAPGRALAATLEDARALLRHGNWRLPDVGKPPAQQPLVKGVRRAAVYQQINAAFDAALRAAADVELPDGADLQDADVQRRVRFERRHAAESVLKQQLGRLGLDASGLSLRAGQPAEPQPADLLSLARPLDDAAAPASALVGK